MTPTEVPTVGRPRPLLWLYGLIAVSLVSVGVIAGRLFFFGVRKLYFPYALAQNHCAQTYARVDPSLTINEYVACMAGPSRVLGAALLTGAVVVLAGALLLTFAVPLWDRRRLRRFGRREQAVARERFEELCRRHGLSARRAPRLWVAGPALRHAFTTAVPGRRPTIVVPARLALDAGDEFDAIVSHELAHVLARDVTWVSAVRGPLWLFIPVVIVASLAEYRETGFSVVPATVLIEVTLLVAMVAIFATALLRLREHEADRYAARTGGEAALLGLFQRAAVVRTDPARFDGGAVVRRGRPRFWSVARRLAARHPAPTERALALHRPDRAFEGGFAQAVAISFVAMMAMATVTIIWSNLNLRWQTWQGSVVPCGVGVAVLAIGIPSLFRRARARPDRPQWWRPVIGSAVGIVLGALGSPAVTVTGEIPFPIPAAVGIGPWIMDVGLLALLVAGSVAIAISLAVLAAGTKRPVLARIGMVAASLTVLAATWPVTLLVATMNTPGRVRTFVFYSLVREVWPMLAVGLILAYIVLLAGQADRSRRTGREWRAPWLVAGVATVVGGAAAILITAATAASGVNDLLKLRQQQWWICAGAGAVVLVIVAVERRGRHAWAEAVLAAVATSIVTSGAHYLYAYLTHRPALGDAEPVDLFAASIWLFYIVVLAAPALATLPVRGPAGVARPVPLTVPSLVSTASVTALVAVLVLAVGVPGGFVTNSLQPSAGPPVAAGSPTPTTSSSPPAATQRVLSNAQAKVVADAGGKLLPERWLVGQAGAPGRGAVSSTAKLAPEPCRPLATEGFMSVARPHLRAVGTSGFTNKKSGLTATELSIDVYSYDESMAEVLIAAADNARVACPAFTAAGATITIKFAVRSAAAPAIGERSWRYNSTLSAILDGNEVTGATAYVIVATGYTVIVAYMTAILEPLDEPFLERVLNDSVQALLTLP